MVQISFADPFPTGRENGRGERDESLDPLVPEAHASRPVYGGGSSIDPYPQSPYSSRDRRYRGGSNHLITRRNRRRPQLGLPLLLVARLDFHTVCPDGNRFHGRGEGLA